MTVDSGDNPIVRIVGSESAVASAKAQVEEICEQNYADNVSWCAIQWLPVPLQPG